MPNNPKVREAWRARVAKIESPHFAHSDTTLSPAKVDTKIVGHHVSVVFESGTRHFIFEGQANRDRFVNLYRPWGAKPCKDPCP
jgi:hypothetical protein